MNKTKAFLSFLLIFTLVFFITGCTFLGFGTVKCTNTVNDMGIQENIEITTSFKNNHVNKTKAIATFDTEENAKYVCDVFKQLNSNLVNFSCNGKTITFNNYDVIMKRVISNYNELTKDEYIKELQDSGYTCK